MVQQGSPVRSLATDAFQVNWGNIQGACLEFVLETHLASKCQCGPAKPCKQMVLVQWAQKAAKVAQNSPGASIFGARANELASLTPRDNHGLFADLFLAVKLFGNNMSFVPQLFHHMQQSFQDRPKVATPPPASSIEGGDDMEEEDDDDEVL